MILAVFFSGGCNRAAVRIPGASLDFPETITGYKAKKSWGKMALVDTKVEVKY
jgi:hypothetical protein